uniref:G-protein coupled receptors family 1 profile domain-containing protein n=1 Tax=Eptatretus burgeri TaxID=7764 RepID=A0A8C4NHB2_EPTBU
MKYLSHYKYLVFTERLNLTEDGVLPLKVKLNIPGSNLHNGRFMFWLFLAIMLISVFFNFAVISACFYRRFNSPMLLYIALASIADTFWGIVGVSSFFNSTIASRLDITFKECLVQMFCLYFSLFQQFFTTWMMYVDRHWAIFWPYSYVALVANKGGAAKFATIVWAIGLLLSISFVAAATQLVFCNTTVVIPDFICAFFPLAKSSCGNSYLPSTYTITLLFLVIGLTGFTVMYSTWCIVRKCRKSTEDANVKALHTCFTQLFVSVIHFLNYLVMIMFKRFVRHQTFGAIVDLMGITTPALINPLIFGFRVHEIRPRLTMKLVFLKSQFSSD